MIKTKIKKLEETKEKLKKEFVGIDDVIDRVITSISPWYLTPEVLERPLVVSLWGLTGTGKTSLVRKLSKYLDLEDKTIYFDCGEQDKDSGRSISESIDNMFGDEGIVAGVDTLQDLIFVFDEFQCARTINEHAEEENKANLRAIWTIMDSGILNINDYRYDVVSFINFVEDVEQFSKENPGLIINNGCFCTSDYKLVMETIGLFHYGSDLSFPHDYNDIDDGGNDKERLIEILPQRYMRTIIQYLSKVEDGYGYKTIRELKGCTTLGQYLEILKKAEKIIRSQKKLDCSKSLVFILGNLDEAYGIDGDMSPDVDADLFRSITEDIGITEVKTALQERFRNEQIGRFGNNLITYPSLRKKDFQEIIDRELDRIINRIKEIHPTIGNIEVGKNFKNLIYSEGVFPSQGVRPVLSTIGNLFTSKLSTIIQEQESVGDIKTIIIDTKTRNFDKNSIDIFIVFKNDKGDTIKEIKQKENLNLGKLRNVDNCDRVVAQAVHEASHSIVYTKLTGKFPTSIVAVSSMGGGVMYEDFQKSTDISSREEVDSAVMVSLAGYLGELEFFSPDKCLMGSASDISKAWEELSWAIYKGGYVTPRSFTSEGRELTTDGRPLGILDKIPKDMDQNDVQLFLLDKFKELEQQTKDILSSEKELIKEMSLYLAKNRTMSIPVFKKYIKKYSKTMTLDSIKEFYDNKNNYYYNALKK